jgi:hypothetical protein
MKNINLKTSLTIIVGISILSFFILISVQKLSPITLAEALKLVPQIVSINLTVIALFSGYIWKWKIFKGWLVPFPNLNGTWIGTIQTTWIDPITNVRPAPIPTMLTIKQSFFKISCVMRTAEMTSRSCIADFILDKENQIKRLCYTYDSNPISTVRERSPQHCGTTLFEITENDIVLKGEYWTGRKTTGEILVRFSTKEILDSFPDDMTPHPVSAVRGNNS